MVIHLEHASVALAAVVSAVWLRPEASLAYAHSSILFSLYRERSAWIGGGATRSCRGRWACIDLLSLNQGLLQFLILLDLVPWAARLIVVRILMPILWVICCRQVVIDDLGSALGLFSVW